MSKQFDPKDKSKFIENPEKLARKLFGYDDETLLRELKEAELELEQMKAKDPDLEAWLQAETEAGFEALMQKIRAENIKPVTEREYYEKIKAEERQGSRLRPVLKSMFVAAAILVVLSGMGGVVSARREFEYQYVSGGKIKNETIWRNGEYSKTDGQLVDAYKRIGEELGINVLVLNYKPRQMLFNELIIDKGHARIKFIYNENTIYLKEIKDSADQITDFVSSDRKEVERVYNRWLKADFIIEENKLEKGIIEYSTKFKGDGAYYYLQGIIDKDEFIKIIKSLSYMQE